MRNLKALRTFSDDPNRFDLVIVDPVMPELNGVELAVCLQAHAEGLSGHALFRIR